MSRHHWYVLACVAALTVAGWAASNRSVPAPQWSGRIDGLAYSPVLPSQRPARSELPSEAEIAADLARIAEITDSIRTYSIDGTLASIPRLARNVGLRVTVGVWLDSDHNTNRRSIDTLARLVSANDNVVGVMIGNETQLTESLPSADLIALLELARRSLDVPVSTAEPWHVWLANPELARHVDYLTVHLLPYWEGFSAQDGPRLVAERMTALARAFPEIPIVIGEAGWPSHGRSRDAATASRTEAETFLRGYLRLADAKGYDYFLMEAVDQPWKQSIEGVVGAHWGWLDADRNPKYALDAPLRSQPRWPVLAAVAMLVLGFVYWLLVVDSIALKPRGLWLAGLTAGAISNASVAAMADQAARYWSVGSALAAVILGLGVAGMIAVMLVEVREWAEARFGHRRRIPKPARERTIGAPAKVSIHVPIHAEPPAMVIATLDALARLEYPSYEVIVVDNNTAREDLWQPVAAHCRQLGARFRFFHVAPLEGYKAGALNFALQRTAPDAEIVAVIDSDYCVDSHWLASNAHHFEDPKIAIVQARQDYRDREISTFKRICEAEYRGFFDIGMVTRNDRNAIIQHGTMTLIRARTLREVGGWAEWTVTEDAELGLRILAHGHDAIYSPTSYGRGLTPDSFRDYRAQRHRWALGAVQILKRYGRMLLGLAPSKLTLGQRVQFLAGWLPWIGDGLNLAFNLLAIGWSSLMIVDPLRFSPPLAVLSCFVLAAFFLKLLKTVCLYRRHVGAGWDETLFACWAGLALIHVVGRAVLGGLLAGVVPFVRTPKLVRPDGKLGALASVTAEAGFAIALLAAAIGVAVTAPFDSVDRSLWICLLVASALPHCAAVIVALVATAPAASTQPLPLLTGASRAERF